MESASSDIRVVLFDLGGVLVELSGLTLLQSWLGNRMSEEEIYTFWLTSPVVRAFETGKMQPEIFGERLVVELSLPVSGDEFLSAFCSWMQGVFPESVELVRRVPRTFIRASLCNSNALHWPVLMANQDFRQAFDHHFASHLMGKIKPDEEAFQHVLGALGCSAPEVLYVDDSRLNVEAAKKIGINAFQVRGPVEAERVLNQAGVLQR
jgi:FMN phosphatase YigB (HAD superfamily)